MKHREFKKNKRANINPECIQEIKQHFEEFLKEEKCLSNEEKNNLVEALLRSERILNKLCRQYQNKEKFKVNILKTFESKLLEELQKKSQQHFERIKNKNCLKELRLEDLIKPCGIADILARISKGDIKITQLRKFFNEIKRAVNEVDRDINKAKLILMRIYPILAYAEGRKLMPSYLANFIEAVIEKVENCHEKESFTTLKDFMTALYAYFKKYEEKR